MMLDNEMALIESILFLESDPISLKSLAKITGITMETIEELIKKFSDDLQKDEHRGLELAWLEDAVYLVPKKMYWEQLKDRYGKKQDKRLSKAAMETLSIIAYSQPITRVEIDNIRGVSSDGMIRLLLHKELITEVGKKDVPGRPSQFGTTKHFLQVFGISSIADLPRLSELESRKFELNS